MNVHKVHDLTAITLEIVQRCVRNFITEQQPTAIASTIQHSVKESVSSYAIDDLFESSPPVFIYIFATRSLVHITTLLLLLLLSSWLVKGESLRSIWWMKESFKIRVRRIWILAKFRQALTTCLAGLVGWSPNCLNVKLTLSTWDAIWIAIANWIKSCRDEGNGRKVCGFKEPGDGLLLVLVTIWPYELHSWGYLKNADKLTILEERTIPIRGHYSHVINCILYSASAFLVLR